MRHATPTPIDTVSWTTLRWVRGTRLGRARSKPTPSIENALLHLAAIAARRRKRGYELTSTH
jgi:hypothetical protein